MTIQSTTFLRVRLPLLLALALLLSTRVFAQQTPTATPNQRTEQENAELKVPQKEPVLKVSMLNLKQLVAKRPEKPARITSEGYKVYYLDASEIPVTIQEVPIQKENIRYLHKEN
ncbi:hypothetical protein GCM10027275_20620 [Rhabdobacter roseus]|uniref:DUF1236 domain-containing protein n=1 Tax=Rhabdobacter roseus TaxID=1655419 RepID=A0A840TRX2_9BACT|nr:hypothetical protein [Rhabdobacter roseus]MBB5283993.1 hypothetical protein [Rhabdobacter roseus]